MDAADRTDRQSADRISEVFELLELAKKAQHDAAVWEAGSPLIPADGAQYVTRISVASGRVV